MEIIKHLKNIEKLCKVEQFILTKGRGIKEDDKDILKLIVDLMKDYTYGWNIWNDPMLTQLKDINEFKNHIIGLLKTTITAGIA